MGIHLRHLWILTLLLSGCTASKPVAKALLSAPAPAEVCRRTEPWTPDEWAIVQTWPDGMRWARPGDVNCDGAVDFDDIDPFVEAIASPATAWPKRAGCRWLNADCNFDCAVDFDDIPGFVSLLSH